MIFHYRLSPLGDNGVMIQLGKEYNSDIFQRIQMITHQFEQQPKEWMIDYIPALTTIAVLYDPLKISVTVDSSFLPYDIACKELRQILNEVKANETIEQRTVEIPVCYGGKFGPDLGFIAKHNHITTQEVIDLHSNGCYMVHMIGFAPGFPYMSGMSDKIMAPRKETPRLKIPARSVGIAGKQTGIYPIETPGGWQIIGRTPIDLFRPFDERPSLLQPGDRIKFKPISIKNYFELEEKMA